MGNMKWPLVGIWLLASPYLFAQTDFKGSSDHPLISRYAGSFIDSYAQNNYEAYPLMLDAYAEKRKTVEGEFTTIVYHAPAGRSQLEVHRNYEKALQNEGFEQLFRCTQCGNYRFLDYLKFSYLPAEHYSELGAFDSGLYTVYQKGGIYVVVMSATNYDDIAVTSIDIVQNKDMEMGMVDANAIATALKKEGKISIYGITFDTGSATIKPESKETLNEIATFLKGAPGINLYIVGHTDDTGSLATNMQLSEDRAASVIQALTSEYGVAANRLASFGAGPHAPVATNETDEGKAKNRRVELVKRLK